MTVNGYISLAGEANAQESKIYLCTCEVYIKLSLRGNDCYSNIKLVSLHFSACSTGGKFKTSFCLCFETDKWKNATLKKSAIILTRVCFIVACFMSCITSILRSVSTDVNLSRLSDMSLIFSLSETVWLDENNHVLKLKRDLKTFFYRRTTVRETLPTINCSISAVSLMCFYPRRNLL